MAELLRATLTALAVALCAALPATVFAATAPAVSAGSDWYHLTPAQKQLLAPFKDDWNEFAEVRKLKWIGIADRFPKMTPPEQANVRERMQEWSKLTPQERQKAREQYKKLRTVPLQERRQLEQKWREYQALPPAQKEALKAAPKPLPSRPGNSASAPIASPGKQPPKPVVVAPRTPKPSHRPAADSAQDELADQPAAPAN